MHLIAVIVNSNVRGPHFVRITYTTAWFWPPLVWTAVPPTLLCMFLELYRDDGIAAHPRALRTWPGVGAQSRLHYGILAPFSGSKAQNMTFEIPTVPSQAN